MQVLKSRAQRVVFLSVMVWGSLAGCARQGKQADAVSGSRAGAEVLHGVTSGSQHRVVRRPG